MPPLVPNPPMGLLASEYIYDVTNAATVEAI